MKYSKKHKLDKFYTKPEVAKQCIKHLRLTDYTTVIEPSAGSGSFSNNIKHNNFLAFDLEPENENIIKQDWFEYSHKNIEGKTLVIGNPPFGLRNNLSKAFIKHAIKFADTVAMILPNVYNKHTLQSIFPKEWRLKKVVCLPENAFTIDGDEYHVPCSFFIFDKSKGKNLMFNKNEYRTCDDFEYCKKEDADFYMMGAGGKIKLPSEVTENNRGYWLKSLIDVDELYIKLTNTNWDGHSSANGGVSWLTKAEVIKAYKGE